MPAPARDDGGDAPRSSEPTVALDVHPAHNAAAAAATAADNDYEAKATGDATAAAPTGVTRKGEGGAEPVLARAVSAADIFEVDPRDPSEFVSARSVIGASHSLHALDAFVVATSGATGRWARALDLLIAIVTLHGVRFLVHVGWFTYLARTGGGGDGVYYVDADTARVLRGVSLLTALSISSTVYFLWLVRVGRVPTMLRLRPARRVSTGTGTGGDRRVAHAPSADASADDGHGRGRRNSSIPGGGYYADDAGAGASGVGVNALLAGIRVQRRDAGLLRTCVSVVVQWNVGSIVGVTVLIAVSTLTVFAPPSEAGELGLIAIAFRGPWWLFSPMPVFVATVLTPPGILAYAAASAASQVAMLASWLATRGFSRVRLRRGRSLQAFAADFRVACAVPLEQTAVTTPAMLVPAMAIHLVLLLTVLLMLVQASDPASTAELDMGVAVMCAMAASVSLFGLVALGGPAALIYAAFDAMLKAVGRHDLLGVAGVTAFIDDARVWKAPERRAGGDGGGDSGDRGGGDRGGGDSGGDADGGGASGAGADALRQRHAAAGGARIGHDGAADGAGAVTTAAAPSAGNSTGGVAPHVPRMARVAALRQAAAQEESHVLAASRFVVLARHAFTVHVAGMPLTFRLLATTVTTAVSLYTLLLGVQL